MLAHSPSSPHILIPSHLITYLTSFGLVPSHPILLLSNLIPSAPPISTHLITSPVLSSHLICSALLYSALLCRPLLSSPFLSSHLVSSHPIPPLLFSHLSSSPSPLISSLISSPLIPSSPHLRSVLWPRLNPSHLRIYLISSHPFPHHISSHPMSFSHLLSSPLFQSHSLISSSHPHPHPILSHPISSDLISSRLLPTSPLYIPISSFIELTMLQ